MVQTRVGLAGCTFSNRASVRMAQCTKILRSSAQPRSRQTRYRLHFPLTPWDRFAALGASAVIRICRAQTVGLSGPVRPDFPKPDRSTARRHGHFAEPDSATTPGPTATPARGQLPGPKYTAQKGNTTIVSHANRAARRACFFRSRCTQCSYRCIGRSANDVALERVSERLVARRESVEHSFGTIRHWMGQGAFLTRGPENVRGEFSLAALAYDLRRAIYPW